MARLRVGSILLILFVIASSLSKAAIYGGVSLPISSSETKIGYSLLMSRPTGCKDINYAGSLAISQEGGLLNAQALGVAKFKINTASFDFEYTNEQFYPAVVIIDGSLTLGVSKNKTEKSEKSFASFGLNIKKLKVSSREPYLYLEDNGSVKMSGSGNVMANFPVTIDSVGFVQGNGGQRVGLTMTLGVKLQKTGSDSEGSNGFEGKASFTVWTKRDPVKRRWAYDDFDLNKIVVKVDNSSFSLYGEIETFDTETEFCGHLDLKVLDKIGVKASAIFGRSGQITIDHDLQL